jgi:hypothetical protein
MGTLLILSYNSPKLETAKENLMAQKDCVPYGSDVSAGTYKCADCGYEYSNQSKASLPPCPNLNHSDHPEKCWKIMTGQGDAGDDPSSK